MNFDNVNRELFSFLDHSPNAFFAVRNMCDLLSRRMIVWGSLDLVYGQGILCHQK